MDYYSRSAEKILEELSSARQGLTEEEAEKRLKEYGPNKLPEAKPDSLPIIFLRQFENPLIYILIGATLIVFYLGEIVDGLVILAVLVFNAVIGAIQEGRAQSTLSALKKFVETKATVLRESREIIIPDSEVAPGDIIIFQEGEKIAADARMIVSRNLKVDQAILTGESEPVFKTAETLHFHNLPIADQRNMVFKGTYTVGGNGEAVVVSTGSKTAIGKIGQEIAALDTEMPLKTNIRYLSRLIIIAVSGISAVLFFVGFFLQQKSLIEIFKTVVALAVSIIPEGLPIVITVILASGVWRMAKRNAVVKKLAAVEALGQAKVIAVDKTGTITKNELMIERVSVDGKMFEIRGVGYEPKGDVYFVKNGDKELISPPDFPEFILAGKIAAFCANARILYSEEKKTYQVAGDPTEAAILVLSQKINFQKEIVEKQHPLIHEIPFDYRTKYHATLRRVDSKGFLTAVGAPEAIFELSKLSKKERERLESVFYKMSRHGLRVLAFAFKDKFSEDILEAEKMPQLDFGGFYGMKDSLRPEVKEAAKQVEEAGMRIVMITGDHKLTAEAIAKEAGIFKEDSEILSGEEIERFSEEELAAKLDKVTVFARVTPEHKLKIIQAYRRRGEIVAMTGDGVNDAPPLVAADLGVAMGRIGTEVAKEAADIVLLDDNFKTIISAVEEGRAIYKTIKKVILYFFSTSLGEVLTISTALFLGYPLPLLATQIIWLNFVTDPFLGTALAMEPKEKNLLRGEFKRPKKHLVDFLMAQRMIIMALPMALGTFFVFKEYLAFDLTKALTISLTTLAIFQWFNVWNCRSEDKSIFQINPFSNKWLVVAMPVIVLLQLLAVYHPFMQKILRTAPLELTDWLVAISIAFSVIIIEEIRKFIYRNFKQ